jgi:two-component system, NtrC family, sensor kinase
MDSVAVQGVEPGRPRPAAGSPRVQRRPRRAIRRRLFLPLSLFALAFVVGLLFEAWRLHRIDQALGGSRDNEVKARRALELENAVHSQYAHQAHFVVGDHAHLTGQRDARERARELTRTLKELADDPVERKLLEEIGDEGDKLDREFMNGIVPAVLNGRPEAMLLHDKSYAHVAVLETKADELFEHFQEEIASFRSEMRQLESGALSWALVLVGIAPLFAAAVAVYIGRSVARPLALLGDGATRVASGDLDARIDLDTNDEFGVLAAEFNAMTASLREHQTRLVQSEKLAGIGRLAAGFAHEIANPLTVVLGFVMRQRREAKGQLARELEIEEREILHCKEIVQELLDLARPADARGGPVNLRELCVDVVDTLRSSGNLPVQHALVMGTGRAMGAAGKLRQVVVNLLKNAAEATGPEGNVEIRIVAAGDWAELTVSDDGPGIGPDVRPRLFEPFFTTKPDGTGLGLAVSRSIAHAHGGDIEVGNPEKGASFTLRLRNAEVGGAAP